MAQLEFLERLDEELRCEQWIVRDGGILRNAYVYDDEDLEWLALVEQGTRTWVGFAHPRVVPVIACKWIGSKLVIVVGDQRGPSLLQAARRLADAPAEREAWAVAELIAIGEALGAMARHQRDFVHRHANTEQLTVGADGHVQLRAPIAHVSIVTSPAFTGRANELTSFRWMAPEQLRGRVLTPAVDVYQLASTLYAALAGSPPFASDGSDVELMQAILGGPAPPPPPARAPGLAHVVMRGLARSLDERYPHPAAFAAALRACAPGEAPPETLEALATWRQEARPAPGRSVGIIGDRCSRRWDELARTADDAVRHCTSCKQDVVQVRSIEAIIPLLGRRCVAYRD